jgi:hypothetical protein
MIVLAFLFYSCSSVPDAGGSPEAVPSGTVDTPPNPPPEAPGSEDAPSRRPLETPGADVPPSPPEVPGKDPAVPPQAAEPVVPQSPLPGSEGTAIAALPPEVRPRQENPVPERPEFPATPEYILGTGRVPSYGLALFLLSVNLDGDPEFITDLAQYYTEEAALEGVNHDIAFAQMCLETGFLRYGGLVTPEMNNFCGLGSIGPGQRGEQFSSPRVGVRAHIQHLKAYATDAPLQQELVDPRYFYVRLGSAATLDGLTGSWAVDREYSKKIRNILQRLYAFAFIPAESGILVKTGGSGVEN